MDKAELKLRLERERQRLTELVSLAEPRDEDASGPDHPDHMAEHASELVQKEYEAGELASLRYLLKEVDHALAKLNNLPDKFGYCEKCGKKIEEKRLKAKPWARYCLQCRKVYESTVAKRKK
ncbi:TraR/DksA family transcriptional regulator [Thermovirga lienii DSM 17291]|jgi:DnaK suppressor protein|uniref:TraR/DksA family transcriptional regulator n=1 Tax=Thermovirga lienii (strain ATCC BAA-1197 / DSM 17291 / Cas60314) TaxID=580340 RepID=G7V9W7_THELD|nr:TraR/DksA C4-type zinc finger protein [Thermovirga lienii]MDN5319138.1 DnaK suppressor protein [Thermovirga sp.]AER66667.1 TraR/DksA family transcriptional regulator [Thermovirga lienii DSM 17291]KUK42382.1 MAG: TraR/DksA family transcriptional regulator [Thermovirga lienii]MDN5367933.1 DnaK suppressor protein [Thermovirga sp.]HCD71141.1 hypothetical protein [Thermovirga lienii]